VLLISDSLEDSYDISDLISSGRFIRKEESRK
jgi:hypothetical protein